ncbi:MAG: diacylglycerol kinase family protein [Limimaricola sp.]|uniref:diacylglycerol kinase family protein n=1 Tax=Limimaricola sp. TaxID=2211665 RepID=UPI001E1AC3EC|nr:diacylglycerol kinase family protein [Limimaricola sp.]MBI1415971.1 diacylglycerol kinase family protein [Limimaricola sp.]
MRLLRERARSFRHAFRGLGLLLRQPNAVIHLLAAFATIGLAAFLRVRGGDWIALIFAITLVLAAEAINTALERVVDLASPEWSALARDAKDLAAACVLVCAIGAVCIGLIVFWPYLVASAAG